MGSYLVSGIYTYSGYYDLFKRTFFATISWFIN